jgi:hypothetical protein
MTKRKQHRMVDEFFRKTRKQYWTIEGFLKSANLPKPKAFNTWIHSLNNIRSCTQKACCCAGQKAKANELIEQYKASTPYLFITSLFFSFFLRHVFLTGFSYTTH